MSYTTKKLENSQVEFSITVTPEEYAPHLEGAAARLSARTAIKGFRHGKAPYAVIRRELGDMAILQEALEPIIKESFYKAVMDEKLDTIGMPQITIEKMAPDNDVVYKAVVALLPKLELPDLKKISVKRESKEVTEEQITETLDAIRGMHAVEVLKDAPATGTDKLVLDMNMFIDNVPMEGGQAKDYQVYLSEKHYIPGFNEQVEGMKKGDEKEFSLDFPDTHYQKQFAGKKVDFKVSVKDVFERQLPELNDELAQKLGQESMEKLKELIVTNMKAEAKEKSDRNVEIAILEEMIDKTKFDPIPEVLIDAERQKMFYELKRDLDRNGVSIEDYLRDIKKDEKTLYEEFKVQAEKRAKAALVSRQVSLDKGITVSDAEVDAEIEMMNQAYKNDPEYIENIKKPEVRDTIKSAIQNRKVMQFLKAKILGEDLVNDPNLADLVCQDCKDDPKHKKHTHHGDHVHKHGEEHDHAHEEKKPTKKKK